MKHDLVEQLTDRLAITDLIYRYCRSMDRIDRELGYSIWHEDGVADYGATYRGTGRGFIDVACAMHGAMIAHSHQISNILIEIDGDKAGSESYVTAALRYMEGERRLQVTVRARYIDRWSRRAGSWGIDKRVYVHDFDDTQELGKDRFEAGGSRSPQDISYSVLTGSASI